MKKTLCIILCFVMCVCLTACLGKNEEKPSLWEDAIHTQDRTFGEGTKTITVQVKAEEKSVNFTINTDEEILADVLTEHDIISGQEGPYGIYVTVVNGMEASYEENKSFWSLEKDGVQLTTGVSETPVMNGDSFSLVYTII